MERIEVIMVVMNGCNYCVSLRPMISDMLRKYHLNLKVVPNTSITPEIRKTMPVLPHIIFKVDNKVLSQWGGIPKGHTMNSIVKRLEKMVLMNLLKKK